MSPQEVYKQKQELYKQITQIKQCIDLLELACEHDWKYERDPAGGSDSGYYCEACGRTRKKI